MSDFQDYQTQDPSASPPWLSSLAGLAWSLVLGLMKQVVLEGAKQAAVVAFPLYAPTDALPHIAAQRDLVYGFPEKLDALRERLRTGWRLHALDGTQAGIVLALRQIGYTNITIEDHADDALIPEWHFRVVLNRPFPFDDQHLADATWGAPGTWGDGGVWAAAMPPAHLGLIRALIRKHISSEARCLAVRVIYDATNLLDRIDLDA